MNECLRSRTEYMKEYMRNYRKTLTDNQRVREALRSAYRRYLKKHPEKKKAEKPDPVKVSRCMAKDCLRRDAMPVMVAGMKAYLCEEHRNVNIFA